MACYAGFFLFTFFTSPRGGMLVKRKAVTTEEECRGLSFPLSFVGTTESDGRKEKSLKDVFPFFSFRWRSAVR